MIGYGSQYYNEIDQKCCDLLSLHIEAEMLPAGCVDQRDIRLVEPCGLRDYGQKHFFAGIGALPLGFKRAGLPSSTDIATGGFPCQDLSVAGSRKGLAGERSGLWFEFHRIFTEIGTEWLVIENVPGLLSANGGRDFAIVLGGLTGSIPEVPKGGWKNAGFARGLYGAAWRVLDAQFFGVPQRRRRVFIIGHLGDGRAAKVLFERQSLPWDSAPSREERNFYPPIAGTLSASGGGLDRPSRSGNMLDFCIPTAFGGGNKNPIDVSTTLSSHGNRQDFESKTFVLENNLGVRRLTPTECERLQGFPDGWTYGSDAGRYHQLGNAIAVTVAEWLGRRIKKYL
jgi:DNA (cytosine-5)-methyltransferase 1